MDWYQALDPQMQQFLFGAGQNFIGGVAANVVERVLSLGGYAVQKPFKAGPQYEALHHAAGRAMHATAVALAGGDPKLRDDYVARLAELAQNEVVAGELANLLLPQPRPPDIAAMRAALAEAGYQADPEYPPAGLEELFGTFAREFAIAAGQEPLLQGTLQIRILTQIAADMRKAALETSRVADAAARIEDAVAPLAPTRAVRPRIAGRRDEGGAHVGS